MKDNHITKGISTIFSALIDGAKKDKLAFIEENKENALIKRIEGSIDHSDTESVEWIYSEIDDIVSAVALSKGIEGSLVTFVLTRARMIEQNFEKLIVQFEGGICCADKSSTLIRSVIRHICHGVPIVFNFNQEYTYHYPRLIFTDEKSIMDFVKGLHSLEYGNNVKFLMSLKELAEKGNAERQAQKESVDKIYSTLNDKFEIGDVHLVRRVALCAHKNNCSFDDVIKSPEDLNNTLLVKYKASILDKETFHHCFVIANSKDVAEASFIALDKKHKEAGILSFISAYKI